MMRKMLLLSSAICLTFLHCIAQEGFLLSTVVHGIETAVPITTLTPTSYIMCRNHESQLVATVTKVFADRHIKLTLADSVIGVGCKQQFCANVDEWIHADELRVGDALLDVTGNHHLIQDIEEIHESAILYGLTVDDRVFCIEPYGLLVHNMAAALGTASTISLGAVSITNPVTVAVGVTLALSVVAHSALDTWRSQQRSGAQSLPESVYLSERAYYESRKQDLDKLKNELLSIKQDLQAIKAFCNPSVYSFTYLMLSQVCVAVHNTVHPWLTISKGKELQLTKSQQQELRMLRQQDLLVHEHEIIGLQTILAIHSNELIAHIDACCAEYRNNLSTWNNAFTQFQCGHLDPKAIGQLYACLLTQDHTLTRIARTIQEGCLVGDYYQRLSSPAGSCIASSTTLITAWQQMLPCVRSNTKWIEQDKRVCAKRIAAVEQYFMQRGGSVNAIKANLIKTVEQYLSSYDGMVLAAAINKLDMVSKEVKSTVTLPAQEVSGAPEEAAKVKTVEDVLAHAEEGERGRYCKQFIKGGGYLEAFADFEALGPTEIKDISKNGKKGLTGVLPDGRKVNVREKSDSALPTLEIQPHEWQGRAQTIKIRYNY